MSAELIAEARETHSNVPNLLTRLADALEAALGTDRLPTTHIEDTLAEMRARGLDVWADSFEAYLGSTSYGYVQANVAEALKAAEAQRDTLARAVDVLWRELRAALAAVTPAEEPAP